MNKAIKLGETLSEIQAKITKHEKLFKDLIAAGKIEQDETGKNKIAAMATELINELEILKDIEKKLNQEIENERIELSSKPDLSRILEENKLLKTQVQDWNRYQRSQLKARLAEVRKPMSSTRRGGKRSRKNKKSHKKRTHKKRTHKKRTRHTRKH